MDKTEVQQPVKQTKQGRRAERRLENQRREQERRRAAKQRRLLTISGIVLVAVVVIGYGLFAILNANGVINKNASTGTANSPSSAYTSDSVAPVVDNIACETNEQTIYHIHAHISIYINGQQQALPANIGINDQKGCYYWLHTHDTTGVIHIESPQQVTYTLGNFFHIWGQQFSQLQYPIELDQTSDWQVYL
ncbi:MAG TPA: hypothetical protein VL485_14355, partial [Ktedonobacteraceae bacterium]|nr:hypothetical protein [Ktedonobacteraceae bacterium]